MIHIRVVTPIVRRDFRSPEEIGALEHPGLRISHTCVDIGPASIESAFEETVAAPGAVIKIVEAEREGADAVVIDCLGDIGMHAGREAVTIPVVGAGQSSMQVAAMLGHRFSILTTFERVFHLNENQAKIYGVHEKLASLRAVDTAVLDLDKQTDILVEKMVEQGVMAICEDGAHVLLFGCTGMEHVADAVARGLRQRGYDVPVVEPLTTAIRMAETLVRLGLRQSKLIYPHPPVKLIQGYPLPA